MAALVEGIKLVGKQVNLKSILCCKTRRLLIGQVKGGKTYGELIRMFKEGKDVFSIIVTINQTASRNQTRDQALEVGFKEENIIFAHELSTRNNRYGVLAGKLLVVNLHETYDTRVCDIIGEAHQQNLKVNYTSDEYDANAVLLNVKKEMVRHTIERRWIASLHSKDTFTCVSATNAVGFFSDIEWTKIIPIKPWSTEYKGMDDILVKTMDDFTAEELENGIVGSSLLNRIQSENNSSKKALLKVTNLVKWDQDNPLTQTQLLEQFLNAGIHAVVMNGTYYPTDEEYDAAVVVIVGQLANRTKEFRDVYTQYLNFGRSLHDAAIIQSLRLCGARPYTPKLYVPESKLDRVTVAIAEEKEYLTLDWDSSEGKKHIARISKPLPDKIAGIVREKQKLSPKYVISEEEYTGITSIDYPLIDTLNRAETKGTRQWKEKADPEGYVVKSLINTWSKDRVQNRNAVIPNSDGVIPQKGIATSIRLGIFYEEEMTQFATYYVDPETFEIKIALWKLDPSVEEKDLYYVETESRTAA
jgi:hypothetical protein